MDAQITRIEAQTVAYLPMTGPYSQIPEAMGRLYGWVAQHGLTPAGPPQAVYMTPPGDEANAEWQLWAPVAGGEDRELDEMGIGVKHLESFEAAVTMHRGPYDTVAETYQELMDWMLGQGRSMAGPPMEVYFSGPEVPPAETLTEIRFPVS